MSFFSATIIFDRLLGVWTVILTVTEVNSFSKLSRMLCSKSFGLIGGHIWGDVGRHIRVLVFVDLIGFFMLVCLWGGMGGLWSMS